MKTVTGRAWARPPDFTVSEWADAERRLSAESSAEPGTWRTSRAEYQRGMMDAANDPAVNTIVIMASAQVGKTEILNNILGYFIAHDPSPILVLQPTIAMAETWSKDRLAPMLRDTPCLKDKVSTKSRDGGNTLLHKTFPGGHVTMAGANSPASLASRPIRINLDDEVDRYPSSAGEEGDPVKLANKRTKTFWNRLNVLTSTPTIKGASRIEDEYELSDKRRYHVPCPHCGELQHLCWDRIVFNKEDFEGEGEFGEVTYACVNGCVIEEKDKPRMIANGQWIAEAPFRGRAGFHINELYSPWSKWAEIVLEFLESKDNPEKLKTWVNTSLGESWEVKGEEKNHETLMERREPYDKETLPDDILVITASVDVQKDRLEALSQGWGLERERWNIEHQVFWGDPEKPQIWKELDDWLKTSYQVGERKFKIACCAVDSGYKSDEVYKFTKPRQGRRVFSTKGSSGYYEPIASKPRQVGRIRASLYMCGADTGKDSILLSSLNLAEAGANYIHFPHDVDEEFFLQLTGEKRIKDNGKFKWVKKRERNEILDLHVGNLCAYAILNPDTKKIKKRMDAAKKKDDQDDQEETEVKNVEPPRRSTQKPRKVKRKRNWINDYK